MCLFTPQVSHRLVRDYVKLISIALHARWDRDVRHTPAYGLREDNVDQDPGSSSAFCRDMDNQVLSHYISHVPFTTTPSTYEAEYTAAYLTNHPDVFGPAQTLQEPCRGYAQGPMVYATVTPSLRRTSAFFQGQHDSAIAEHNLVNHYRTVHGVARVDDHDPGLPHTQEALYSWLPAQHCSEILINDTNSLPSRIEEPHDNSSTRPVENKQLDLLRAEGSSTDHFRVGSRAGSGSRQGRKKDKQLLSGEIDKQDSRGASTPDKRIRCPSCDRTFTRNWSRDRHRTSNCPKHRAPYPLYWFCRPITVDNNVKMCPSCQPPQSSTSSRCPHRFSECWNRAEESRSFSPQDKAKRHFREYHSLDIGEVEKVMEEMELRSPGAQVTTTFG